MLKILLMVKCYKYNMNEKTKTALQLLKLGYSVVPVKDKVPYKKFPMSVYQKIRKPTEEEIINWFESQFTDANIAICTGKISNLTILDEDTYKGTEKLDVPEAKVQVKSPRGGLHSWYRYCPTIKNKAGISDNVDTRNDGGYAIVPPSNFNGDSYEWIKEPVPSSELTDFPQIFGRENELEEDIEIDNTQWDEVNKEGTRDDKTTRYVGKLIHEVSDLDFAWSLLKNYNQTKNKPPLDEWQLKKIFNSITSREPDLNSKDEGPEPFNPISFDELNSMEFPENKWLVEKMFLANDFTILAGNPDVGKTWLYLLLALKVSTGQKFLGFKTTKTKVLIIDKENKYRTLKDRLRMLGAKENVDIYFLCSEDWIVTAETTDELLKWCKEKEIGLVVLDSLRRLHNEDENDSTTINNIYQHFRKLLLSDISILITHHLTKGDNPKMRGSGDIKGCIDAAIIVTEDGENKIKLTYDKSRNFEKIRPMTIEVSTDGSSYYNMKPSNFVETTENNFVNQDIAGFIESLFYPGVYLEEAEIVESVSVQLKCRKEDVKKTLKHLVNIKKLETTSLNNTLNYTITK